jgi:hypothetical protein
MFVGARALERERERKRLISFLRTFSAVKRALVEAESQRRRDPDS